MWEKIERWIEVYCIGAMSLLMSFIEKTHGVVAIGAPMLITAGVYFLLPRWASIALAVIFWIPAAMGMAILIATCWPHLRK